MRSLLEKTKTWALSLPSFRLYLLIVGFVWLLQVGTIPAWDIIGSSFVNLIISMAVGGFFFALIQDKTNQHENN